MISKRVSIKDLAGIQYLGLNGITQSCINSITRLISTGEEIHKAYLITCVTTHGFLLVNEYEEEFAIKAGFSSGYSGEGPRGLAVALTILERHKVEIEEYEVNSDFMQRLEYSCLLRSDLEYLKNARPILPRRWHDYIYDQKQNKKLAKDQLIYYYPLSIPFSLIDPRITDLAVDFYKNEDAAIISAFRRLEDILRKRTGLLGEGAKLFSKVYLSDDCPLQWDVPDDGESKGRANLFIATYMAYRNARVHRECNRSSEETIREFLLVNELYKLEAESMTQVELEAKRAYEAEEAFVMENLRLDRNN